jgi:uncharacterized caspase-like protein
MEQKWALLIGNSRYDNKEYPPLEKSVADVQALAEALRNPSIGAFDGIQQLIDLPGETIRRDLDLFFQEKKREDLLLLYLTGHAVRDRGNRWYFICADTKSQTLRSTAISASFIRECMETCQSKQQVIIIDTCHAAAFFEGEKGTADIAEVATRQFAGYGRATLAAAGGTESAWEGDKSTPTSIFTFYLVQGLITGKADKDKDGAITVDEWFDYTCEQVRSANADQTPRKQVENQHGSLIVARNPYLTKGKWVKEASEGYRKLVGEVWANQTLSEEHLIKLRDYDYYYIEQPFFSFESGFPTARTVYLSPEEAASIEREVMGDVKEAIYRKHKGDAIYSAANEEAARSVTQAAQYNLHTNSKLFQGFDQIVSGE